MTSSLRAASAAAVAPFERDSRVLIEGGRFHAFDSLRAAAMLLGIFFHASLAYVEPPLPFWVVQDESRHVLFGVFAWASHSFRMQLFFVMAGFFGRLVLERYGAARFARHRALRLGVPFAIGILLDNALQQSFFRYTYAAGLLVPDAVDMARTAALPLTLERFFSHFQLGIYWFLEYLICLSVLAFGLTRGGVAGSFDVGRRRVAAHLLERGLRALVASPVGFVWLALPQGLLLYATGEWVVGNPTGLLPEAIWLAYYGIFFGFGWALHRHADLLAGFDGRWRRDLALALPVGALALAASLSGLSGLTGLSGLLGLPFDLPGEALLRAVALFLTACFSWLMVFGAMGAFLHFFSRERPVIRYVSDSSYWLYLTHDYYVMGLQILLASFVLASALKFTLVMTGAATILFLSYEGCVRYSAIGAVLNGRKTRPGRAVLAPSMPRVRR